MASTDLKRRVGIALAASPLSKIQTNFRRRKRGRLRHNQLDETDIAIVSYPKSGRTWLCVMMSRACQLAFNLPADQLLKFDNYHRLDNNIPKFLFTHDDYLEDIAPNGQTTDFYVNTKTVFLVRHPIDTVVSYYFHWKYRWDMGKRVLHRFPLDDRIELFDFMIRRDAGLPRLIVFLNRWAVGLREMPDIHLVRYEDLHRDPVGKLAGIFDFSGMSINTNVFRQAADDGSFDNIRKMEISGAYSGGGSKLKTVDPKNLSSFKARRGKMNGYLDYFSPQQIALLEEYYQTRLDPYFGYTSST